ncbi:MAG TPA: amino acid racemase [Phycisphaerales bacterium]|nr:amino acid racemase [Phycisphaerales bacterium]
MNHIGIVGVSPEGAALFYRQVSRHAGRVAPPDRQPRVTLHNEPLSDYIDAIRRADWHTVGKLLRRSADNLARCGAQFCLTPDNAVQHGVHLAEVGSPIPWMPLAEHVSAALAADGRKVVGILGTQLVTKSSTYQTHLGLRGIQLLCPNDEQVEALDRIIFSELIFGSVRPESRELVRSVIRSLDARGCEAIILASSELPLVVAEEEYTIPCYDTAELLAEAAAKRAAGVV